jgi:hypothetical protein
MSYKETQYGWLISVFFVAVIGFMTLMYLEQWGTHPVPKTPFLIMVGLFVFILSLFYKMTIHVEGRTIKIVYGIGLIRIKIKPDRISGVKVFNVPWYWGVGIRITPKGWLYSINGFKALIIEYEKDGLYKSVLVGTPAPEELKSALEQHFF